LLPHPLTGLSILPGPAEEAFSANSFHCLKSSSSSPKIVFIDFSNSAAAASMSLSLKPQLSREGSLHPFGPGFVVFAAFDSLSFTEHLPDVGSFSKSSSAPIEKLVKTDQLTWLHKDVHLIYHKQNF
jgi:hypothetical protein